MNTIPIEHPDSLTDYELLDSGDGEKLERFNSYLIVRPDPRALWQKTLPAKDWKKADATYTRNTDHSGSWDIQNPAPNPWIFHYDTCAFALRPTDFKHVGIFPEQAVNWAWMKKIITNNPVTLLNLFAYTGGASILAAKYGAHVTHVDSSKSTITWANQNFQQNAIPKDRIRWIEDDALTFVQREAKRGKTYDAIIMDPPRFGRGSKGEIWKLESDLPKLLKSCKAILSPKPTFVLINAYTADLSAIVLDRLIRDTLQDQAGTYSYGELTTKESASGKLLPQGIFARWQNT